MGSACVGGASEGRSRGEGEILFEAEIGGAANLDGACEITSLSWT